MDVWIVAIVTNGTVRDATPFASVFLAAFQESADAEEAVRAEVVAPILSITLYSLPENVALAFGLAPGTIKQLIPGNPQGIC